MRLRRDPARDDLPLAAGGRAALPRLRVAGPDRDPAALPQRLRPAARARALLPPRHPPADRAADAPRPRRVPGQGPDPGRLPELRARLPPLRRRRLGRLRLPVDVLDPRLRADHRPDPYAAAVAPDVRGPQLRYLLVLPAQARLRPAGDPDPVPPLEPELGGDDLLRLRELRLAARDRGRFGHAPSLRDPARAAPGPGGEVDRPDRDARAGRDVRHLSPAAPDEARKGSRRRRVRLLVARGAGARRRRLRRGPRRSHLALLDELGEPDKRGGVAEHRSLYGGRGCDLGQDSRPQLSPYCLEQRLAPRGREPAADAQRARVAGRDERGRRKADRLMGLRDDGRGQPGRLDPRTAPRDAAPAPVGLRA